MRRQTPTEDRPYPLRRPPPGHGYTFAPVAALPSSANRAADMSWPLFEQPQQQQAKIARRGLGPSWNPTRRRSYVSRHMVSDRTGSIIIDEPVLHPPSSINESKDWWVDCTAMPNTAGGITSAMVQ